MHMNQIVKNGEHFLFLGERLILSEKFTIAERLDLISEAEKFFDEHPVFFESSSLVRWIGKTPSTSILQSLKDGQETIVDDMLCIRLTPHLFATYWVA